MRITGYLEDNLLRILCPSTCDLINAVVAPTVNVNISDETVSVKSRLSTQSLREFMDGLLAEYSVLFRQNGAEAGEAGCGVQAGVRVTLAPDGVTPMDAWLERVLGNMQKDIEAHIATALDDNDTNATR